MKFQGNSTNIIKKFFYKMKKRSKTEVNPLNPKIPFEKSYFTDLLHGLISEGNKLKAIPIHGGWLELDTIDDYKMYNDMKNNNTLSQILDLSKI